MKRVQVGAFSFDTGPSLFTLPQLIDELFEAAGKDRKAYLDYAALPVITKYFYPDGTVLDAYADANAFAKEAEEKTGEPAQGILDMLADSKQKYELTEDIFLRNSLHKASTFLNAKAFKTLASIGKLGIFSTMDQANRKAFRTTKIQQLFNRYATYNGSDPFQAPSTLNVIPHLEHNIGAYYPKDGMYSVAKAL